MNKTHIVGGGLSGLLAAKWLEETGIEWVGHEKSEALGGRFAALSPRLFNEKNTEALAQAFPGISFSQMAEPCKEARKGVWGTHVQDIPEWETFYLTPGFYLPEVSPQNWVQEFVPESVRSKFQFNSSITQIDAQQQTLTAADGTAQSFSRLFWCGPLSQLLKCFEGTVQLDWKLPKNRQELGCVTVEMTLSKYTVPEKGPLCIGFRFGEGKARALGTALELKEGKRLVSWTLFLEESIAENKEEIAQCIRNFKRELFRQFPDFEAAIESERIVYLPRFVADSPIPSESLEIAKNIFYLGPELKTSSESTAQHWDLLVENYSLLKDSISTSLAV